MDFLFTTEGLPLVLDFTTEATTPLAFDFTTEGAVLSFDFTTEDELLLSFDFTTEGHPLVFDFTTAGFLTEDKLTHAYSDACSLVTLTLGEVTEADELLVVVERNESAIDNSYAISGTVATIEFNVESDGVYSVYIARINGEAGVLAYRPILVNCGALSCLAKEAMKDTAACMCKKCGKGDRYEMLRAMNRAAIAFYRIEDYENAEKMLAYIAEECGGCGCNC